MTASRGSSPRRSPQLGWSIVVDNRTGAVGTIGIMAAKQAAPDGYTLVVVTSSTHGSTPALKRNLSYDPVKDFVPIVLFADAPLVLLVRDDLPVRSVAELVQAMRDKPGTLNYSSGGYGSQHHLATVTLVPARRAAADRGGARALCRACARADVVARRQRAIHDQQHRAATQHIASGKLRPLAITSLKRSPRLPDVPTMAELGYPGFEVAAWCGLAAPAGTPEPS